VPLNPISWLRAARAIDSVFQLEKKHTALLEAQAKEIQDLKDRVTKLEAREEILIAEAKGAAAAAAGAVVAQLAREIGALDERTRRLAPPSEGGSR
jgi:hypothetical protein